MTMTAYLIMLPFTGFYESDHVDLLDHEIEMLLSDDQGEVDSDLADRFHDHYGWTSGLLDAYGRQYVNALMRHFEEETGIQLNFEFDEIHSPRFYNFETDRLFAEVDGETLNKLADVPREVIAKWANEEFAPRSGFMPFYSSDITDWPENITEWDHNQLFVLLEAWMDHNVVEIPDVYELMEHERCNGVIDSMVHEHMPKKAKAILDEVEREV